MKAETMFVFQTGLGWMGLVASPRGLRAVLGPSPAEADVEREALAVYGPLRSDSQALAPLANALRSYAAGEHGGFDFPLDMEDATPFRRQVWQALLKIPFGQLWSYGDIAGVIGRPGAARAVGQAVGSNPFTIIVPCHRVVGSDGTLTGYGGGLGLKEKLLAVEGLSDASERRARTENRKGFRPARRAVLSLQVRASA